MQLYNEVRMNEDTRSFKELLAHRFESACVESCSNKACCPGLHGFCDSPANAVDRDCTLAAEVCLFYFAIAHIDSLLTSPQEGVVDGAHISLLADQKLDAPT